MARTVLPLSAIVPVSDENIPVSNESIPVQNTIFTQHDAIVAISSGNIPVLSAIAYAQSLNVADQRRDRQEKTTTDGIMVAMGAIAYLMVVHKRSTLRVIGN